MTIPDYETLMLPILTMSQDGQEYTISQAKDHAAKLFNLSEEEQNESLPSGNNKLLNRISWARLHLKRAGLLSMPRKGVFVITNKGLEILTKKPKNIDTKFLSQIEPPQDANIDHQPQDISSKTPEELMEISSKEIQKLLEEELLDLIKSKSPKFFENLIVELCEKIFKGKGKVTGRTGDGGIDGIIDIDKLGLDIICLQAKRWERNVSEPDIRDFAGSLQKFKSKKGIFITTSDFASPARHFVKEVPAKIILINGKDLVRYMIDYDVGVKTTCSFQIKKIDSGFFTEEES